MDATHLGLAAVLVPTAWFWSSATQGRQSQAGDWPENTGAGQALRSLAEEHWASAVVGRSPGDELLHMIQLATSLYCPLQLVLQTLLEVLRDFLALREELLPSQREGEESEQPDASAADV
ncbi:hypothetical protein EYF80_003092 [Liparis tanakae]|uniref:Uncharacterized protein n=1 Tax=Liparis tanakae TaxID=230148 RepID=A0A4Z2JA03_9TELE|nr:hypothetical protein EYF80_003092 [Liparis tanakae]